MSEISLQDILKTGNGENGSVKESAMVYGYIDLIRGVEVHPYFWLGKGFVKVLGRDANGQLMLENALYDFDMLDEALNGIDNAMVLHYKQTIKGDKENFELTAVNWNDIKEYKEWKANK